MGRLIVCMAFLVVISMSLMAFVVFGEATSYEGALYYVPHEAKNVTPVGSGWYTFDYKDNTFLAHRTMGVTYIPPKEEE